MKYISAEYKFSALQCKGNLPVYASMVVNICHIFYFEFPSNIYIFLLWMNLLLIVETRELSFLEISWITSMNIFSSKSLIFFLYHRAPNLDPSPPYWNSKWLCLTIILCKSCVYWWKFIGFIRKSQLERMQRQFLKYPEYVAIGKNSDCYIKQELLLNQHVFCLSPN